MAEIFTVETRGIGKPDYSKEVSSGKTRPGMLLKYRQSLIMGGITFTPIISPYTWIKPVLAAGGIAHLIDWQTGLSFYTCEKGYAYSIVTIGHSANQDHVLRIYISTPALGIPLSFAGNLGTTIGGEQYQSAEIVPYSTIPFDPTALYSHVIDLVVQNLGNNNMEGSCTISAIKEAIGTPPPPLDKTVKCKWCGHEWVVPRETTYIKCPNCDEFNIYCDFSKIRSIG